MTEIKYSIEGLDDAITEFGASSLLWEHKEYSTLSLEGSGDTPEVAHAIANSRSDAFQALGRLASSTKSFFESSKALMTKADASSPFEG